MRRAIALSGGGTKGAYEMGVWKAFLELGIEYDIVTGTSIGALNGALMATREYEKACEIWDNIDMRDVMVSGLNLTTTIEGMYNQREAIRPFLKKFVKNKGADISPFYKFIDTFIDEEKVRASQVDFGLVTMNLTTWKGLEITKGEIPQGMLKDYILASSAIFPLFPIHHIGKEMYVDGCYYDNVPIDLALKMGADEVVAIDLQHIPQHRNYVNKPYVKYIAPAKSLGTMMNFERSVLDRNRLQGYYDTLRAYGRIAGFGYLFYQEDLERHRKKIDRFVSRVGQTECYLTEGTFKKFIKPGDSKRLCGNIEEHIPKETYTRQDYFLGTVEICGEIFELPKEEPWYLDEFVKALLSHIIPREEAELSIFEGLGPMELASRLAELKLKQDSKYITGCIFHAYQEGMINLTEQLGLLTIVPYELAAALLLLAM